MAISTIGTDALASAAVTSAKLASGAPSRSQLPAGTVLQVVSATYGTAVSSTSSTYATTGLSASITPTSATSKIAVIAMVSAKTNGNNYGMGLAIYKNGSSLFNPSVAYSGGPYGGFYGSASAGAALIHLNYVDSPATTSATTYAIYFGAYNSNSVTVQPSDATNNGQSSIILMEIAA